MLFNTITTYKPTHFSVISRSYSTEHYIRNLKKNGLKLTPDTVQTGIHFKSLPREFVFKVFGCLNSMTSNDKVHVNRSYQAAPEVDDEAEAKKVIKAYKKTLMITLKGDSQEKPRYVHISYDKCFILRNPYDVKFSCHMSRLVTETDIIVILGSADPSGILKLLYLNTIICRLDIKFDFHDKKLNFFLKHFDCRNGFKTHVKRSKDNGGRTFQINKNIYLYEKLINGVSYVRLEIRLTAKKMIQRHFPRLTVRKLLAGGISVPKGLFGGWNLVIGDGVTPRTVPEKRIDHKVQFNLKKIDLLGKAAMSSLLQTKQTINKAGKDKGKFNISTKNLYKRESFYDDFLTRQRLI